MSESPSADADATDSQPAAPAAANTAGSPDPEWSEPTGGARLRAKRPWIVIAFLSLVADLVTKWLVFYPIRPEGAVVGDIASWWSLRIAYNRGVTFGVGKGASAWLLSGITALVIAILIWNLWSTSTRHRAKNFAFAIIIGGAIGNLYDRTLRPVWESDKRPGVRDFLDWYVPDDWAIAGWVRETFGTTSWYTSNVADVLIVTGVILLAILILREKPEPSTAPLTEPAPENAT